MNHFRSFFLFFILIMIFASVSSFSQSGNEVPGDEAMAEKYLSWALNAITNERWTEAEAALERAADFADISSDLPYLLALCRQKLNRPQGAILNALEIAIETDHWNQYEASDALILKAETWLALKMYAFAIAILDELPESPDTMAFRLRALQGSGDIPSFLRMMTRALNLYEHDPRPVSILFDSVDARIPALNERGLVDIALRRLPLLVEKDPSLAYKAVPFMRNTEDARRMMQTYRAENLPHPKSLPSALDLGVIDEETMMCDLFSYTNNQYSPNNRAEYLLDLYLVRELWNLLRTNDARDAFIRNLSSFSGVIIEDADGDSYPESISRYENGRIRFFDYDIDQDRLAELSLSFYADNELPQKAEIETINADNESQEFSVFHEKAEDQEKIALEYFDYPSVKSARLGETEYFPVYREFFFAPVEFVPMVPSTPSASSGNLSAVPEPVEGPLYPELRESVSRLTKRSLISFANIIKRPSREFPEAIEEIHLTNSVVNRAREVLPDGSIVSEMLFEMGEPYLQYVDLDFDGRMETRRVFKREGLDFPGADPTDYHPVLEKSESDFNGDDSYEYGEIYLPDGMIERSWDSDGDGSREVMETGPEV